MIVIHYKSHFLTDVVIKIDLIDDFVKSIEGIRSDIDSVCNNSFQYKELQTVRMKQFKFKSNYEL
jgi:hypothetical protein